MELRVIPPQKKLPNEYDSDITFVIPAKLIRIERASQQGRIIPVKIERLDFETGDTISTDAITFQGSLEIFDDQKLQLPFYTNCVVYKVNGKIKFKVIGIYNPGFKEMFFSVADNILDNDERQIKDLFKSNYKELLMWSNV